MDANVAAYLDLRSKDWTPHDLGEAVDFVAWIRIPPPQDERARGPGRLQFVLTAVLSRGVTVARDERAPAQPWVLFRAGADNLQWTRVLAEAEILASGTVRWDGTIDVVFETEEGAHQTTREGCLQLGRALALTHDLCLDAIEKTGGTVDRPYMHRCRECDAELDDASADSCETACVGNHAGRAAVKARRPVELRTLDGQTIKVAGPPPETVTIRGTLVE